MGHLPKRHSQFLSPLQGKPCSSCAGCREFVRSSQKRTRLKADIPVGTRHPYFTQGIHILMDRFTGKTLSECFIEFPSVLDARKALEMQNRVLKGRLVSVHVSSQEELSRALFPRLYETQEMDRDNLSGLFSTVSTTFSSPSAMEGVHWWETLATSSAPLLASPGCEKSHLSNDPCILQHQNYSSLTIAKEESLSVKKTYLSRDEIQSILTVCKNYKASQLCKDIQ